MIVMVVVSITVTVNVKRWMVIFLTSSICGV